MHLRNSAAGKTVLLDEKVSVINCIISPQSGLKIKTFSPFFYFFFSKREFWAKRDNTHYKIDQYAWANVFIYSALDITSAKWDIAKTLRIN